MFALRSSNVKMEMSRGWDRGTQRLVGDVIPLHAWVINIKRKKKINHHSVLKTLCEYNKGVVELNQHQTAPGDPFTFSWNWQFILLSCYYSAATIKPQADKWYFLITSVCSVSSASTRHMSPHSYYFDFLHLCLLHTCTRKKTRPKVFDVVAE